MNAELRIALDKHVKVVEVRLHLDALRARLVGNLLRDLLEPRLHIRGQQLAPVLDAPDDVAAAPGDDVEVRANHAALWKRLLSNNSQHQPDRDLPRA